MDKTKLSWEELTKYKSAIRRGYFDEFSNSSNWKHTFAGAFIRRYPNRIFVLDIFRATLGHTPTWEDLTDLNLMDFKEAVVAKYAANSCKTYFAEIRSLMSEYADSFEIPSKRYVKILAYKREPSQNIYLTLDELESIHIYDPISEVERHVKRVFMVEALTGARHEDAKALRIDNLDVDTDTLTYVCQKTKQEVTQPIHRWLTQYLAAAELENSDFKEPTLATINNTARNICKKCGIKTPTKLFRRGELHSGPKYEFVSSHTGRRSFATNLYLLGCDPLSVAKFMGHANPQTTIDNYIIGYREVPDEAMKFFKPKD